MEKNIVQTDRDLQWGLGNANRRLKQTSIVESLEGRLLMSGDTRPISELGNNVANPKWGIAGSDFIRLVTRAAYADGIYTPVALSGNLSARDISNLLNDQADPNNSGQDLNITDLKSLSDFGYAFGQFIDHDMDLTRDGGDPLSIPVSSGDKMGPQDIPFTRSQIDPATGPGTGKQAEQVNSVHVLPGPFSSLRFNPVRI